MKLTETQYRFRQAMTNANRPCPHDQYNVSIEKSVLETVHSAQKITIFAFGIFFMFFILNYYGTYNNHQNTLVGPLYSSTYIKDHILSSDDIFIIHALIEIVHDVEKLECQVDNYQHFSSSQYDPKLCQSILENGIITIDRVQSELKLLQKQSSRFLKTLFLLADDYVTLVKGALLNNQSKVMSKDSKMFSQRSMAFLVSAKKKHDQYIVELAKLMKD
ncbi:MAG: hypothetical protein GXW96_12840 [Christensenellaceae bacterium]|nr:hypothetical protein [Christensenellaceae bacterium]